MRKEIHINPGCLVGVMKEAKWYEKLKEKKVHCFLCPHNCTIAEGKRGICRARENQKGKLISLVYGEPCSTNIDPVEKKPMFHFMPGTYAYSIGTAGCNLKCLFCQNWEISQAKPEEVPSIILPPEEVIRGAVANDCQSIAYTYTEPTIFGEYVLDCAKLARKKGLKNIMVTNGYIQEKPLKEIYKYIDAANVDLKGFTEEYYKKICGATLEPVLETLKRLKKMKVWTEITTLIVPGYNDNMKDLEAEFKWIKENLGKDSVLHLSRFFPCYKMQDVPITPEETIRKAKQLADKYLDYVYVGNIHIDNAEDTFCPNCKKDIVLRSGYSIIEKKLNKDKCFNCKNIIPGVWD